MRLLILAGITFALAACGPSPEELKKERDQQAIEAALGYVKARLRDPASAQFTDVSRPFSSVCGKVNAKNGFGGYTGTSRFVVTGTEAHIEADDKETDFDILYEGACVDPVGVANKYINGDYASGKAH